MKPFRLTKMLCLFPVLLVVMIVAIAIGLPSTVEGIAPYHSTFSECLVCGRMQTIERRWMQSPQESIDAYGPADWMAASVDPQHDHWWVPCSGEDREEWFGPQMIGCGGGVGGVSSLHYLATAKGDDVARPFVQRYLELVKEGDLKSVRDFVQNDVMPALSDSQTQEPADE